RPHETFETSVRGTARILELAAGRNCRVILASSSEVYGNIRTTALREDRPLPASYGSWPRASYPEGKREAERLLLEFTRSGGDGRIARLFNVSGPGQAWESGMVLPTFVHHALMDLPLPLIGHGRDLRCFQHVEDAVSGLCLLAGSDSARGRIVNLGSQESIEIRRLAARVLAVLGRKVPLVPVSSRDRYGATATRCAQRVPDLERCRRLLGHRAALGLDRIILDIATSRAAVDTGPRAGRDRAVG
ncbi:MAG: NAD-dependent epimerase/dehydratase family protein, partial [Planctomycetota bacterium]